MGRPRFVTGGDVKLESSAYVPRKADKDALDWLVDLKYVVMTEPRQQGKTSLISHIQDDLRKQGLLLVYVDASGLEGGDSDLPGWYKSLAKRWLENIESLYISEVQRRMEQHPGNGSIQEWKTACDAWLGSLNQAQSECASTDTLRTLLRRILTEPFLEKNPWGVVFAIDEVGAIPELVAREFFPLLRALYGERRYLSEFKRCTFAFLGAYDPRDLIKVPRQSPFNIAEWVRIEDFQPQETRQLVLLLEQDEATTALLVARIQHWTDGQPYLTQRLCRTLNERRTDLSPETAEAIVDSIADDLCRGLEDGHLGPIHRTVYAIPEILGFLQNLQRQPCRYSPAVNSDHFRFAHVIGVIKEVGGFCRLRNRIYEHCLFPDPYHHDVFISYSHRDREWVEQNLLPALRTRGLRVGIDYHADTFTPGQPSLDNMKNGITNSRAILLVLTPNWLNSDWTEYEFNFALHRDPNNRQKRIIPMIVQECRPFTSTHYDLSTIAPFVYADGIDWSQLITAIRAAGPGVSDADGLARPS